MSCVIEFRDPLVRFEFYRNKYKQKVLIDALLRYGNQDLESLACILDLPVEKLSAAHQGIGFLPSEDVISLAKLFLLLFSD